MATIDLGKIKLVWRGTYSGSTAYTVDDVVQHTDTITSSFICTTASTGNAPSTGGSVHSSWAYLAKGGVAGTDVGTTITTQGDILFRDGSGLQRLAKPASDMYLKNTSAGAVAWSAISSEMVKLGSTAFTSGTPSEVNLDVTFDDSTYYKYELHGFLTKDSTNGAVNLRLRQAGTTKTDSTYDYIMHYAYRRVSDNNTQHSYSASEDAASGRMFDWNFHGENYPLVFKITSMAEMEDTAKHKTWQTECIGYRHSDDNYMHTTHDGFFGYEGNTSAITGMNFQASAGNFKTGHLAWYGFKR